MFLTSICQNCNCSYQRNPRVKNQKHCSSRSCQNARRNLTNKTRTGKNPASRLLQQAPNKRWQQAYLDTTQPTLTE